MMCGMVVRSLEGSARESGREGSQLHAHVKGTERAGDVLFEYGGGDRAVLCVHGERRPA
jgi:predicted transcriptional regulator